LRAEGEAMNRPLLVAAQAGIALGTVVTGIRLAWPARLRVHDLEAAIQALDPAAG
jgi:hypothetical protein